MLEVYPSQSSSFPHWAPNSSWHSSADLDGTPGLGGGTVRAQNSASTHPPSRQPFAPVTDSSNASFWRNAETLGGPGHSNREMNMASASSNHSSAYLHNGQYDYAGTAPGSFAYDASRKSSYSGPQSQLSQPGSIPSRPASPVFSHARPPTHNSHTENKGGTHSSNAIASYLQIPSTITSAYGSLAEFAAQITCLFWFESSGTLQHIENSEHTPFPTNRLVHEAVPATGFLKWVTTILSTTQVTQNVILLALLFVYRLKKQNPSVKGKPGSEYRLLTVALMLGNKFLDDNTYTNKTWAEVSGISVVEIHVMEVEFLSHMKYNLYTSKDEWQQWHEQLGKFYTYFERASRKLTEISPQQMAFRPPNLQIPHPLPSPPASTNASPPYTSVSTTPSRLAFPAAQAMPSQLAPRTASPATSLPELDPRFARKRSLDYDAMEEPPVKRPHLYYHPGQTLSPSHAGQQGPLPALPSLPMPSLPAPGIQAVHSRTHTPVHTLSTAASGYGTPTTQGRTQNWLQGVYQHPSFSMAQSDSQFATSRQHTPVPPSIVATSAAPSFPSTAAHSGNHPRLSPSHFLMQRSSPYRPVRNISTLLVPPPTSSIENPSPNISYDQMHWQPLSKIANDRRSGRVPYLHREAWPQTHQVDQWPSVYPLHMRG